LRVTSFALTAPGGAIFTLVELFLESVPQDETAAAMLTAESHFANVILKISKIIGYGCRPDLPAYYSKFIRSIVIFLKVSWSATGGIAVEPINRWRFWKYA
jgi:hypothetical protein